MFPIRSIQPLLLTTALAGLVVGGCAPSRKALSTETAQQIDSLQILAVTSGDEPHIQVQQAMTGGQMFGLVGVLVDAAVTSSRENAADEDILQLRAALTDFDYFDALSKTISASADSATWPGRIPSVDSFEGELETGSESFQSRLESMPEDACLLLRSETFLSPQAVCLVIATDAQLYVDQSAPDYSSHFTYFSAPRSSEEQEVALAEWAADDGRAYREAVAQGLSWTMEMLQRDLLAPDRFPANPSPKRLAFNFEALEGTNPIRIEGDVLAESDDTFLVRDSNGYLYAFDRGITQKIRSAEIPEELPSRFKRERT